ncbi:hypothetical protein CAEBREN_17734 [Caenorhabditis brenneri]|uniref:Uncharacterized protein n=1 Tax=Caenorhabditis brenneri TaxID=135651 RepID=G0MAB6_CAEBE|nr:hypothetical protein CAEBREN_17734 [Caenorhabditis brenneri]
MLVFWLLAPMVLLLNGVASLEETQDPHAADDICTIPNTCLTSHKGCPIEEDCTVTYSFNRNSSSLFVTHLRYAEYIILYHHINGERQDEILLCYPYKCFLGVEPKNDTLSVPRIQKKTFYVTDEELDQYLYKFPRIVVPTGKSISYSFRFGTPEQQYIDAPSTPLHFVETSQPITEHSVDETGQDLKSIAKVYDDYNKIERGTAVSDDTLSNSRVKKESTDTVPMTDFQTVWEDRMIFKKEDKKEDANI